jgi:hypothetical protein
MEISNGYRITKYIIVKYNCQKEDSHYSRCDIHVTRYLFHFCNNSFCTYLRQDMHNLDKRTGSSVISDIFLISMGWLISADKSLPQHDLHKGKSENAFSLNIRCLRGTIFASSSSSAFLSIVSNLCP